MTLDSPHVSSPAAPAVFWGGLGYGVVLFTLLLTHALSFAWTGTVLLLLAWIALLYPMIFAGFRMLADLRVRAAAAAHPGAYIVQVVARPSTAAQLRQVAQALGVPVTGGLPWNNYAVFVADQGAVRLWAGVFRPSERVALPTAALVSVVSGTSTIGIRTVTVFQFGFRDAANQVWPLELVPIRWTGFLMRAVPPQFFPAELAAMQHATHPNP